MKIFKIKKTKELKENEIHKIILIKKRYWSYCYNDHFIWFKKNIRKNDLHFFLLKGSVKMYCCLRLRFYNYKNYKIPFYYLDTLCCLKKYRFRVLNFLTFIIESTKKNFTITLCANQHLRLYQLFGFKINNKIKIINHDIKNYNFLIHIPKKNKYTKYLKNKKINLEI